MTWVSDCDAMLIEKAQEGDLEKVKHLLLMGANPSSKDSLSLAVSCKEGHLEVVKTLIKSGADPLSCHNRPLVWAAEAGHMEVVQCLQSFGANIREGEYYGFDDALVLASQAGRCEMVSYLISQGANVNVNNVLGYPLAVASSKGHVKVMDLLVSAGARVEKDNYEALEFAVCYSQIEALKYLLGLGDYLFSALCFALKHNKTETVKFLIARGADSSLVPAQMLEKITTSIFTFTLSPEEWDKIESSTSEPAVKEKWLLARKEIAKKKEEINKETDFQVKISLADLYYRPGETGYYIAIYF